MLIDIISDILFAAIAGVGFGAISNPPARAYKFIALLAGIGHACRFLLMTTMNVDIGSASFFSAILIGFGSLWLGGKSYCPMTVIYIPALLPMIPGKFAYKAIFAQIMFLQNLNNEEAKSRYMNIFMSNATIAFTVVFLLAIGATIPMFIFHKKAYSLTRKRHV